MQLADLVGERCAHRTALLWRDDQLLRNGVLREAQADPLGKLVLIAGELNLSSHEPLPYDPSNLDPPHSNPTRFATQPSFIGQSFGKPIYHSVE